MPPNPIQPDLDATAGRCIGLFERLAVDTADDGALSVADMSGRRQAWTNLGYAATADDRRWALALTEQQTLTLYVTCEYAAISGDWPAIGAPRNDPSDMQCLGLQHGAIPGLIERGDALIQRYEAALASPTTPQTSLEPLRAQLAALRSQRQRFLDELDSLNRRSALPRDVLVAAASVIPQADRTAALEICDTRLDIAGALTPNAPSASATAPDTPRLSAMTPVRLPAGAVVGRVVGDATTADARLLLCPVGQRLTGVARFGLTRVEGVAPLCAAFDPNWSQVPTGIQAASVGVTTDRARPMACHSRAWMTGVRATRRADGVVAQLSPICRGRAAPAPGSDGEWRPEDPARSDCQNGTAIGLSVSASATGVRSLAIVCGAN